MKNPEGKQLLSVPPEGKFPAISMQTAVLPEIFESFCEKGKNLSPEIDF
ncbi:hypothetical protein [Oscillibacter sp. GMB15532]